MTEESTTPDLVELTRLFYEVMDREWDFDALAGFFVTDAVWDLSESHLGIYDGATAIRDFLVGYWATWEDHHHEIEEVLDFGNGVLSVAIREDGCPKGTHARVQARHLQVFEWDQRKIIRITGYPDIDEARAAAERLAKERGSTVSANLDLVRSIYADWGRGDYSSVAWADPEVQLVIVDGPDPGTWTGLAAVAKAWGEFIGGFEEVRTLADEYRSLDDERVLVPTQFSARGKGSGLDLKGKGAILFYIREGKVTRIVRYWEPDRALSDLGLKEQAMSQENLDLVRSIYAAWERGDFSRTTGLHPEITWAYVGGPEPSSGTGMAGMAAPMRDWLHAWDEWHIEATEYRELDGERILVFCRGVGRGKTSELDLGRLSTDGANLFEVHDGKVRRLVIYWHRDRALADLRLAE